MENISKLPWKIEKWGTDINGNPHHCRIVDANGGNVCDDSSEPQGMSHAEMELIVRAVNAYTKPSE